METVLVLGNQSESYKERNTGWRQFWYWENRCLNSVARDKERFLNEAVVNRIVETRIPGF